MYFVRSDRFRPDNSVFVVVEFHDRCDYSTRPNSITSHNNRFLRSRLISKCKPQSLRILSSKLKNVSNLNRTDFFQTFLFQPKLSQNFISVNLLINRNLLFPAQIDSILARFTHSLELVAELAKRPAACN